MASKLRSLSAVLTSLFVLLLPLVFFLRVATSQPASPQPMIPDFMRARKVSPLRSVRDAKSGSRPRRATSAFTPMSFSSAWEC